MRADAVRLLASRRPLVVGALALVTAMLVLAIPTAVIPNPMFTRMTSVRPLDYLFLAASSALIGAIAATFAVPRAGVSCTNRTIGGGIVSALAIGCPICNHVVVALIGISGALTYWAPIQPLLGAAAVLVLGWTLRQRLVSMAGSLGVA